MSNQLAAGEVRQVSGGLAYDRSVLNLLSDIDDMKSQLDELKRERKQMKDELKDELKQMKDEQAEFHRSIRELRYLSDSYLSLRQRFLDVYRRDVAQRFRSPNIRLNISIGSATAHHGDAVTDAKLYEMGLRQDRELISDLYGLSVDDILTLDNYNNCPALAIINRYGTIKADATLSMSNELSTAFRMVLLQQFVDMAESPRRVPSSPLGKAHDDFWKADGKLRGSKVVQ